MMNIVWTSFLSFFFLVRCQKVAIIGEGVVGLSTALAIKELAPAAEVRVSSPSSTRHPPFQIHVFSDRPFDSILSKNIAGLFRIDNGRYRWAPPPAGKKSTGPTGTRPSSAWPSCGGSMEVSRECSWCPVTSSVTTDRNCRDR